MSECPVCGASVPPETWEIGELVDCVECGEMLEVISLSPPQFDVAPEEDEDWGE